MDREIKFRAWHKEQKRMFSPEEMGADQLTLMPDGRGFVNVSGDNTKLSQIDNGNKMIPLQYTGLHDRLGNEIYEGDILHIFDDPPESNAVTYFEGAWQLTPHGLYLSDWCSYSEVIGNIYENKELLK